jgi:hypothetical protein
MQACRQEAGPQPDVSAGVFGLVGFAAQEQDPAFVDWTHRVDACVARKKAEGL